MPRLGPALMIVGAALLLVGLVGRFALGGDDGEAAVTSPPPASPVEPSAGPTDSPVPSPSETPSAEPTAVPTETPEEFIDLFAEAIRTDDDAFLLARLHPVVLAMYGRSPCRKAVASLAGDPEFDALVRNVEGPEPYDYAPDGQSVTVEDAFTLALTFTSADGTSRQEGHLALVRTEMRWFTDCGDPLA